MDNGNSIGGAIIAIITGLIGLAIIAVVFSKNATTTSVIGAAGNALSKLFATVVSPVTGSSPVSGSSGSVLDGINTILPAINTSLPDFNVDPFGSGIFGGTN